MDHTKVVISAFFHKSNIIIGWEDFEIWNTEYIYGSKMTEVNKVTLVPSVNTEKLSNLTQASDNLISSNRHSFVI